MPDGRYEDLEKCSLIQKARKTVRNRPNPVPFNNIWLLSLRRLAQNHREIRMPADLAHRFLANTTLLNAKKTRADFQRPGGASEGRILRAFYFFRLRAAYGDAMSL